MKTTALEIMSTEIISVKEGTHVEEALKLLVNSRITGLPVIDAKGKMVGVFSDYDVILHLHEGGQKAEVFRQPIRFSREIQSVTEKTTMEEIMKLFVTSRFRRLPVLNREGKLVGIITRRDLMKLFYYRMTLTG